MEFSLVTFKGTFVRATLRFRVKFQFEAGEGEGGERGKGEGQGGQGRGPLVYSKLCHAHIFSFLYLLLNHKPNSSEFFFFPCPLRTQTFLSPHVTKGLKEDQSYQNIPNTQLILMKSTSSKSQPDTRSENCNNDRVQKHNEQKNIITASICTSTCSVVTQFQSLLWCKFLTF